MPGGPDMPGCPEIPGGPDAASIPGAGAPEWPGGYIPPMFIIAIEPLPSREGLSYNCYRDTGINSVKVCPCRITIP